METSLKHAFVAIAITGISLASCKDNQSVEPDYVPKTINLNAPVITRQEIFVAAPLSQVWELHTDIAAWPMWNPAATTTQFSGPLQVGSSFNWTSGGLNITSTILEVIPRQRLVWSGPAEGIQGIHVWTFKAVNGGVLIQTEESWEGEQVLANTAYAKQILEQSVKAWLEAIKKQAEARVR